MKKSRSKLRSPRHIILLAKINANQSVVSIPFALRASVLRHLTDMQEEESNIYETEEYQAAVEAIRNRLKAKFGRNIKLIYDAYDADERGMPLDNLDDIAVEGKVRVEDDIHEQYIGSVLENPSWTDLVEEGIKMIQANGDEHHVFFTGFYDMSLKKEEVRRIALDFES